MPSVELTDKGIKYLILALKHYEEHLMAASFTELDESDEKDLHEDLHDLLMIQWLIKQLQPA